MADELRIDQRPELERPVLIAAFRGWNDGAQAASLAAGYLAKTWDAERFADVDPEDFFDFQATRPHVSLEDGPDPPDRLARDGLLPRAARRARPRRRAAARDRAEPALAHVHGARGRPRERARGRADDHARRAARRRAAHAAVAGHRQRDRQGARRAARALGLALRGADRDRRRAPRRLRQGGHPVGEPLGRGAALRLADAEPARPRVALCERLGERARHRDRRRRARGGGAELRGAGQRGGRLGRGDGRVRRGARAARRRARGAAPTCRRATRSPPS